MDNQVAKIEEQLAVVQKKIDELYPQLKNAKKKADSMIGSITGMRVRIAKLNKILWTTIVIFAILIIGLIKIGASI